MLIIKKDIFPKNTVRIFYNTRVLLIISCLLVIKSFEVKAQQEPMYSQYMFNMLQINPAYAGNRAVDNITIMYRKQWLAVQGAPVTATLSWDKRNEDSNIGYGLQIYSDKLGVEHSSGIQGFYSFFIPMQKSNLVFGLCGGVMNYNAQLTDVKTLQSNDESFARNINGFLPTFGFGMLYTQEKWYVGFSVPALLTTKVYDVSFESSKNTNHYFLTGGYIFDISESLKLKPSLLFKTVRAAPLQCDINLNMWYLDTFALGVSYRTGDSFVSMLEAQVSTHLRLGYAYDYLTSHLKTYTTGTHELMLRYEFRPGKNKRIYSPRYY